MACCIPNLLFPLLPTLTLACPPRLPLIAPSYSSSAIISHLTSPRCLAQFLRHVCGGIYTLVHLCVRKGCPYPGMHGSLGLSSWNFRIFLTWFSQICFLVQCALWEPPWIVPLWTKTLARISLCFRHHGRCWPHSPLSVSTSVEPWFLAAILPGPASAMQGFLLLWWVNLTISQVFSIYVLEA